MADGLLKECAPVQLRLDGGFVILMFGKAGKFMPV